MSDERAIEVYRALRESQNRYTYFILAATGAAIALALKETHNDALVWSQVPLGIAVLSWGLSFFFGCRHVAYVNSSLAANATQLFVAHGQHPLTGTDPRLIAAATSGLDKAMDSNNKRIGWYGRWQFRCLVIGAVAYVVWHVLEMYLTTTGPS